MKRISLAAAFAVALTIGISSAAEPTTLCAKLISLIVADPAAAYDALQRGPELACAGGQPEEALLRAYVAFKALDERPPEALKLRRAVKNYDKAGGAPSRLLGLSLNAVARQQLAEGKDQALRTAERAEQVFLAAAPDDRASRARSIIWQAAARLIKQPNFSSDTVDAFKEASRARGLFEGDEMTNDQAYFEAVAWQAAILGLAAGDRRAAVEDAAALSALSITPRGCDAVWTRGALATVRQRRPWSGHLMNGGGFLGAVAVIRAGADGAAELSEIAAEARIPSVDRIEERALRSRDRAVERALNRWRISADAPPECKSDVSAVFGVYIPEQGGAGAVLNEWPLNYEPAE